MNCTWAWVEDYSDVPSCIEIGATFDDTVKKDRRFTDWAVAVANRILVDAGIKLKAHYGKWGARLVLGRGRGKCGTEDRKEMEAAAHVVEVHPSWIGLALSTHVFTYGNGDE